MAQRPFDESVRGAGLPGLWRLLRAERHLADGTTELPYGTHPVGLLLYDRRGYMAVQIMSSDDGVTAARSRSQRSRAAARDYIAYFGRYEVDKTGRSIAHSVEGSLNLNWVGGEQVRQFEVNGDDLVFRTLVEPEMEELHLHWKRIG
jgi:hypothetical protein